MGTDSGFRILDGVLSRLKAHRFSIFNYRRYAILEFRIRTDPDCAAVFFPSRQIRYKPCGDRLGMHGGNFKLGWDDTHMEVPITQTTITACRAYKEHKQIETQVEDRLCHIGAVELCGAQDSPRLIFVGRRTRPDRRCWTTMKQGGHNYWRLFPLPW